jgi:cytochrome c biogenesis protein
MGNNNKNFFEKLWKIFASVKFSIIIFVLIATTSIIGTLIPQNEPLAVYRHTYGESLYKFFLYLDFFDMYHAWWFMLLEFLLVISIIVCSIDRFKISYKKIFEKNPKFNLSYFLSLKNSEKFQLKKSIDDIAGSCENIVKKKFTYFKIRRNEEDCAIFAEKNRWALCGVYIVHLSVVLFLFGALITSIFGFNGYAAIPEGESVTQAGIKEGIKKDIGFELRCDKFELQFYENGSPKEYKSYLTVIEDGKEVLKKEIIVNDPLRYKGINIFQSNYGSIPPETVNFAFTNSESGLIHFKTAKMGKKLELPESAGFFAVRDFTNSYKFMKKNIGDAFLVSIELNGEQEKNIIVPVNYKNFDKMRQGYFSVSIDSYEKRYYTGLQITKDPGVLLIYTGFIVMLAGIFIIFFIPHKRICIYMKKSGNKTEITASGIAGRNRTGIVSSYIAHLKKG